MTEAQMEAIGELPRVHGLLGAMLEWQESYRAENIQEHPRFEGWPEEHPNMRSFLGVPIVSQGEVIGAFYLTEKKGAKRGTFTDEDQAAIEGLAAHAAVAIENARLYERSRELSVVEERNRLARELHDSVTQRLFSISLTAEAAGALVEGSPAAAKEQIEIVQELAREAMTEMRSLIFELRPAELESDGLASTLTKHVDVLRRVHGREIELEVDFDGRLAPAVERTLFRIAQEALTNALKHADPAHVHVEVRLNDGAARLLVADDGNGFDPADPQLRARRLGLTSMRERAEALGGSFAVSSRPGDGTKIAVEVPRDPRPRR
jgi:signal transduction histidine kinase